MTMAIYTYYAPIEFTTEQSGPHYFYNDTGEPFATEGENCISFETTVDCYVRFQGIKSNQIKIKAGRSINFSRKCSQFFIQGIESGGTLEVWAEGSKKL